MSSTNQCAILTSFLLIIFSSVTVVSFGQSPPEQERPPLQLLVLRPWGFEPSELKLPAGKADIIVLNRTGHREVNLQFTRDGAARLLDVPVPAKRAVWRGTLDITEGSYTISVANRPGLVCRVIVSPPKQATAAGQ